MGKYKKDYIVLNFPHNSINSNTYFELMFPKTFKISLDRSIIESYVEKLVKKFYSRDYSSMNNIIEEMIEIQEQKTWIERFSFYLTIQYYPSENDVNLNFHKRLDTYSFMKSNFTPWILPETDFVQLNNPRILFAENVLKAIDFNYVKENVIQDILNKNYIIKEGSYNSYLIGQMKVYLFMKLYEYYKKE